MSYSRLPKEYQEELRDKIAMQMLPVIWHEAERVEKSIVVDAFNLAEWFLEEADKRRVAAHPTTSASTPLRQCYDCGG